MEVIEFQSFLGIGKWNKMIENPLKFNNFQIAGPKPTRQNPCTSFETPSYIELSLCVSFVDRWGDKYEILKIMQWNEIISYFAKAFEIQQFLHCTTKSHKTKSLHSFVLGAFYLYQGDNLSH